MLTDQNTQTGISKQAIIILQVFVVMTRATTLFHEQQEEKKTDTNPDLTTKIPFSERMTRRSLMSANLLLRLLLDIKLF